MNWYSEEELKKWLGHTITLSLLDQMKVGLVLRQCGNCPYWKRFTASEDGVCQLKKLSYQYVITNSETTCKEGFAR